MQPINVQMALEMGLSMMVNKSEKKVTIGDFIEKGTYAILRKCPTAYKAFGHKTMWDMKVTQFHWLLNNLSEEFKPADKKK